VQSGILEELFLADSVGRAGCSALGVWVVTGPPSVNEEQKDGRM